MVLDPKKFKECVQESLRRQIKAINILTKDGGLHFWDYGNAFLLEADRAGAPVKSTRDSDRDFIYPSYVEDIMGYLCNFQCTNVQEMMIIHIINLCT